MFVWKKDYFTSLQDCLRLKIQLICKRIIYVFLLNNAFILSFIFYY